MDKKVRPLIFPYMGKYIVLVQQVSNALYCTVLYWCIMKVLHCTVRYCTCVAGKYCPVLYSIVLVHQEVMHSTVSLPWREEGSTGKYQHEVMGVPEGAAQGNSRDRMQAFSCAPRLKSRYIHYTIYKCDEILAIAITRAMYKAIVISKPRGKKIFLDFFLGIDEK